MKWANLKIKQDKIEQNKTGYEKAKNLSNPSLLDVEKIEIGQDVNPFVTNYDSFLIHRYQDISNVIDCRDDEKCVNTKISLTERNLFCPNMRFSYTNSHWTGYKGNIENHLVQEQKMISSEQFNEDHYVKKLENIKALRTDLKNLVVSEYNCNVKSIPDLLTDFNKR
jgi:hypothetical protein